MNAKQIEALKYLIIKSKDLNDLAKQILFFLIDKSEGLTKEVSITVWEDDTLSGSMVKWTATDILARSHLGALMALIGSEMRFSRHYGHYTDGRFNVETQAKMRYTFWLSKKMCGQGGPGKHITVSSEELSKVELVSLLYAS